MVKNWGDNCSTDDEDDFAERVNMLDSDDEGQDDGNQNDNALDDDADQGANKDMYQNYGDGVFDEKNESTVDGPVNGEKRHQKTRPPKQYDYPTEPPFTAYVGNLAFSIKETQMLAELMTQLARDMLLIDDMKVLEAKIIKDRNTDQPRGFGYIEVESLEILQSLMTLNEMNAMLSGRKILLDTANHKNNTNSNNRQNNKSNDQRRGSSYNNNINNRRESSNSNFSEVDGTKFRGGKHQNHRNSHKEKNDSSSTNMNDENPSSPQPPAERTKLKLLPRSKPIEKVEVPETQTSVSRTDPAGSAVTSSVQQDTAVQAPPPASEPANDSTTEKRKEGSTVGNNNNNGNRNNFIDRGGQKDYNRKNRIDGGTESDRGGDWRKRSSNTASTNSNQNDSQDVSGRHPHHSGRGGRGDGNRDGGKSRGGDGHHGRHSDRFATTGGRTGGGDDHRGGRSSDDRRGTSSGRGGGRTYNNSTERGGGGSSGGRGGGRGGGGDGGRGYGRNSDRNNTNVASSMNNKSKANKDHFNNNDKNSTTEKDVNIVSSNASTVGIENKQKKAYKPPTQDEVPEPKKVVVNKFAALKYDSDSD